MNERLNLQDLVDLLAKKQELTKKDAEVFLRELIAVISETIEQNESVKLKDFGTFKLTKINARKSVDVNTGEAIEIAAHYKLSFTPDKSLREAVNRPFAHFESVILEEGVSFDNLESKTEDNLTEDSETEAEDIDTPEEETSSTSSIENRIAAILNNKEYSPDISTPPAISKEIEAEIPNIEEEKEEEAVIEEIQETVEEQIPVAPVTTDDISEEIKTEETDGIETAVEAETDIINVESEALETEETIAATPDIEQPAIHYNSANELASDEEEYDYKEPRRMPKWAIYSGVILVAIIIFGILFRTQITSYINDIQEDISLSKTQQEALNNVQHETYTPKPDSLKDNTSAAATDTLSSVTTDTTPATSEPTPSTEKSTADYKYETATIESGMTLRMLGLQHYGNKSFWVYIYEENKDKIKTPNNVPLGTVLSIPPREKYGIDAKSPESVKKARQIEEQIFKQFE